MASDSWRLRHQSWYSLQGTAPGTGRSARAAAIENAQLAILIDRLAEITGSTDLQRFGGILDNPSRYFRPYRLQQSTNSDTSTTVVIEATLLDALLRRDAATLLISHLPYKPRIFLAVSERLDPKSPYTIPEHPVAHTALVKILSESGFDVLALDGLREKHSGEELASFSAVEPAPVSQFARQNLADIVVVGNASASSEAGPAASSFRPYRAKTSLSIIRAGDATVLAELTAEAVVQSIEPKEGAAQAIRDACDKMREPLTVEAVLGSLTRVSPEHIVLTVKGLDVKTRLPEIRNRLESQEGIEQVEPLTVSENAAWLQVVGSVPVKQVAEMVTRAEYPGFRVKPQGVVDKDIMVSVETVPPGE